MATLVPENHPALHTIAEEVTEEELQAGFVTKLVKDMKSALRSYSVEGFIPVAIAAPQIGISKRVFIIDDQSPDRDPLPAMVAVNPKLVKSSKKMVVLGEGCLSIPDKYGEVLRHTNVTIEAIDEHGVPFRRDTGGLLAQIIQHEYDHLDGILFTDRAERFWDITEEKSRQKKDN